ncbi:ATP-grasp domain-containing protein [Kribbella sandramycini]|uniref:ATP-grasp domain-containing protein n=1 Tax=Kribbella sandramycini TaxID=60450 RepID=A0A7Y4NXS8_9ACTN|nr:ATP-grasp domain-containing protein [Kribbella sandramycini]MBB6567611.1 biotin carboxylase [Kribbella sandramycini]NOL39786.1 ATP-grasp domain-containing protein [Kribbella sandramycini]
MRLYVLALNPTDSVTEGFLPAAARLGLDVTLLTDSVAAHASAYEGLPNPPELRACDVRDFRAVIGEIAGHHRPDAIFSNSDHLQAQTALAAQYFGLPGKNWQAAFRAKNKAETRRILNESGLDTVWTAELAPDQDPETLTGIPFPVVVKPREGVASEDVALVAGRAELIEFVRAVQQRRTGAALLLEEFLAGELHTLETLGDATTRQVLGGFRTAVSPPPAFIEESLEFVGAHPAAVTDQVLAELDALGVGFGACHTEFVVQADGRARLIEVNYRSIGDRLDLALVQLLGIPYFEQVLRIHLGEPLPADLGARADLTSYSYYLCADRSGTLTAAPEPFDRTVDGIALSYRTFRELGATHPLYTTNRDYLGVIQAIGPDRDAVHRIVAEFVRENVWEITP